MTTLWLRRVGNALHPDGDESVAEFAKLPFVKSLRCEIKQPRNAAFHRLYWAVCARIATGVGSNSENISDVLKIATGHYTTIRSKNYGEIRLPKSIAFHNLDETAFREFFLRCLVVIFQEWGIGADAFSDLLDVKGEYGTTKMIGTSPATLEDVA